MATSPAYGASPPLKLPSPVLAMKRGLADLRLLRYASGNFGKNITFSGAEVTFLFLLTELMGLRPATAGALMLAVLAGDLVFDLIAARIVIAMQRRGRSYRWLIVAGAAPCGLAFAGVYALPLLARQLQAEALPLALMALVLVIFRGAYALIDVPHNAMMTRIADDSRVRGRVSGYRRLFSSCSSLTIALVLTPLVQDAASGGDYTGLAFAGLIVGLVFTATMVACATGRPKTIPQTGAPQEHAPARGDSLRVPLGQPLVLAMLAIAFVTGFACPAFERMVLYLDAHVLERPGIAGQILTAITIGQFAGVAGWTALTVRVDSARLLCLGHAVCLAGLLLFAVTGLTPTSPFALLASALVLGLGQTAIYMLPWGILADVVDALDWKLRRRFEAGLFALFLVAIKASGAASSALLAMTLDLAGYSAQVPADENVRTAILILGLALPAAGSLGALAILARFDLGHRRHARLKRALAWRASRAPATSLQSSPR